MNYPNSLYKVILLLLLPAAQICGIPYRAAYQYGFVNAYSASVDLPNYEIVDLGQRLRPIDINDNGVVLLWAEGNRLMLWKCGQTELLCENFTDNSDAFLNENNLCVAYPVRYDESMALLVWQPHLPGPQHLSWGPANLENLISAEIFALNDQNLLILQTESHTDGFPIPPSAVRRLTGRIKVDSGTWSTVASYDWNLKMDFSLEQGGKQFEVFDFNNLGDTVGWVYSASAYTAPFGNDPIYSYQSDYFAFNQTLQLDFEPLQVNDARTILGMSPGPIHGLVIVDQYGQRPIGPPLNAQDLLNPRMSNPRNGLEEIVIGNRYFKRMVERDFSGRATGFPSPDFHGCRIEDIIRDPGGWSNLNGTCISANGRIAGTGRRLNPLSGAFEDHAFILLPGAILPDWDRNGSIDTADRHLMDASSHPFRLWINDDNDNGDQADSSAEDLPGQPYPDCESPGIDGLRDVVDFFPVQLDLQDILNALPDTNDITITLRQQDAALNFVYTNLYPDEVGYLHQRKLDKGFGPDFASPLSSAPTHAICATPVSLAPGFIHNIRTDNRGVLLLEGRVGSQRPLEICLARNGKDVVKFSLQLSISPVRDMFRIINLRNADAKFTGSDPGPWPTDTSQPPNLPDTHLSEILPPLRTLVHIHGYNWNGEESPAAHAEVFKRFFQSGSQARFIGLSWFGDQGKLDLVGATFDYNQNVANAFITARHAASALAPFSGPFTYLFAHSLGNAVASCAIQDFDLSVGGYFMVNAAVPSEAYMGEQDNRRLMVHPDWKDWDGPVPDYAEFLLSANWFRLFPASDRRSALTWKNRFGQLTKRSFCRNFYSSGEEVLAQGTGDIPPLFEKVFKSELVWTYNEMQKGTTALTSTLTGETQAGWGFNHRYMDWVNPGGGAHLPGGYWERMPPAEASLLEQAICISEPFFRGFSTSDTEYPAWGSGEWLYEDAASANTHLPEHPYSLAPPDLFLNQARILASAIPAHSFPSGSTPLTGIPLLSNYDMDTLYRHPSYWPLRAEPEKRDRWLHNDYLKPSFAHVSGLYRACVNAINFLP